MFKFWNVFAFILIISVINTQQFTYAPNFDSNVMSVGFPAFDGTVWSDNSLNIRQIADVNGDGIPDIVGYGSTGILVSLGSANGWGEAALWSNMYGSSSGWFTYDANPRFTVDLNNDKAADVCGFASTYTYCGTSNTSDIVGVIEWLFDLGNAQGWNSQDTQPRFLGDLNGDGYTDIAAINSNGIYVSLGNGSSFATGVFKVNKFSSSNGGWTSMALYPIMLGDVNGDGKDDFIGFGIYSVIVLISDGNTFVEDPNPWSTAFTNTAGYTNNVRYPRMVADVNGDGRLDVVAFFGGGVLVSLSTGTSFDTPTLWYSGLDYDNPSGEWLSNYVAPRMMADVNCDGKADIVAFSGTGAGIKVYISGNDTSKRCPEPVCHLCSPRNSSCNLCVAQPIYTINSKPSCPPGSIFNASQKKCLVTQLTLPLSTSTDCDNFKITAELTSDEKNFYASISIDWSITLNSTNATRVTYMQDYFQSLSNQTVQIPYDLLEHQVLYIVSAAKYAANGTIIQNQTQFFFNASLIAIQFVDPNPINECYFLRGQDNVYSVEIKSMCPILATDREITVNQLSGPFVNLSQILISGNSLTIPSCSFPENISITLEVSAYYPKFKLSTSKLMILAVPFDEIQIDILNGDRSQDFSSPLVVSTKLSSFGGCSIPDLTGFLYRWTCQKASSGVQTYSACSDPNGIFGVSSLSNQITIPTTYLEQGSTMIIGVFTNKGLNRADTSSTFTITTNTTIGMGITCLTVPCLKYNPNTKYDLVANIFNDPGSGYSLIWTVSNPLILTYSYFNTLKFAGPVLSSDSTILSFRIQVQSSKYSGFSEFILPINQPPEIGNLLVSPTNGISFITLFTFNATGWNDDDQPLKYQFLYSFNRTINAITQFQSNTSITTYLPGDNPAISISVMIKVSDSYGAVSQFNTSVQVVSNYENLEGTLTSIINVVESLPPTDPNTIIQTALIADEIKNSQDDILTLRRSLINCTECPDKQFACLISKCLCFDANNQIVDCTITQAMINKSESFNEEIISKIDETFAKLELSQANLTQEEKNVLKDSALSSLDSVSANPAFGTVGVQKKVYSCLNNSLDILNPDVTMTYSQQTAVSNILSNSFKFSGSSDCNCSSEFCQSFENTTKVYFEKISKDSVKGKIVGESPTNIKTDIFDIVTTKTTPCDISKQSLQASDQAAAVSFFTLEKKSANCNQVIDVYYYAFPNRSQLFNCSLNSSTSDAPKIKDVIMIKMVDSKTQKSVAELFTVAPIMPKGINCPAGCSGQVGSSCFCQPSLFDVEAQLSAIFRASALSDLVNIEALLNWKWYSSPMFWVNIFFLIWFCVSVYLLKKKAKYRDYCIMDVVNEFQVLELKRGVISIFLIASSIAGMYGLKKTELGKVTRVGLYYFRLVLYATFSSIFSSAGTNKGLAYLLQNLQIYVILLPYFTVLPINLIVATLFKKSAKRDATRVSKIKNIITAVILFLIIAGCILAMFIIAAQKTEEAQLPWAVILIIAFIQDIFVSPLIFTLTQLAFIFGLKYGTDKNKQKLVKFFGPKIDENFNTIFQKLKLPKKKQKAEEILKDDSQKPLEDVLLSKNNTAREETEEAKKKPENKEVNKETEIDPDNQAKTKPEPIENNKEIEIDPHKGAKGDTLPLDPSQVTISEPSSSQIEDIPIKLTIQPDDNPVISSLKIVQDSSSSVSVLPLELDLEGSIHEDYDENSKIVELEILTKSDEDLE